MKDDYVHFFVRKPVRRSPIINRGKLFCMIVAFYVFTYC